ncbi:MAG: Ig-like domain-containing protein [Ruminiclostridium sp.]
MKKITAVVLVLLLILVLPVGCAKKNYYNPSTETQKVDTKIEIAAVTLDEADLVLNIGETALLNATVSPTDAKDKPIKWTSSNEKIVSVNAQGIVFAEKEGKATITVSSEANKVEAKCNITVQSIRKAVITGTVPTESSGGAVYTVKVGFENCIFPSIKVIADCGYGSIKTDSETIKLDGKSDQYQVIGKATISFAVSNVKNVSHIRILCFDNGELFDCKEYNISLLKIEEPKIEEPKVDEPKVGEQASQK